MVILSGGLGTRMRLLTKRVPKSMIMVRDKPFLWYQLELLKKHQIYNIVLCAGYLGNQIKEYFKDGKEMGLNIQYSEEKELLGTAGALKKAEPLLNEEFFVMNGDSYLMFDYAQIMSFFKKRNRLALMVVYKNFNQFETSNVITNGELVKLYDRSKRSSQMIHVDAGLYIFRRQVAADIPANFKILLDEIFAQLIEQNELLAFETSQRFYEIGSPGGLKEFGKLMEEKE